MHKVQLTKTKNKNKYNNMATREEAKKLRNAYRVNPPNYKQKLCNIQPQLLC